MAMVAHNSLSNGFYSAFSSDTFRIHWNQSYWNLIKVKAHSMTFFLSDLMPAMRYCFVQNLNQWNSCNRKYDSFTKWSSNSQEGRKRRIKIQANSNALSMFWIFFSTLDFPFSFHILHIYVMYFVEHSLVYIKICEGKHCVCMWNNIATNAAERKKKQKPKHKCMLSCSYVYVFVCRIVVKFPTETPLIIMVPTFCSCLMKCINTRQQRITMHDSAGRLFQCSVFIAQAK